MRHRGISSQRHDLLQCLEELMVSDTSAQQELLVKQLYKIDLCTLEECLLQVSHVCITHPVPEVQSLLRTFMLRLAGSSVHVALRLSWIMDSVFNFYSSTGLSAHVKEIQDCVESYATNHLAAMKSATSLSSSKALDESAKEHPEGTAASMMDPQQVMQKESRLKMFNDVRDFVSALTEFSNVLRYFPDRSCRKEELRKRLREVNKQLEGRRLVHPIGCSADPVRWIVNIAIEECTVFSSRERAPYLIRYEVIVDDTATLKDPTATRLRQADGRFKISSTSDDLFVPEVPAATPSSPSHGNNNSGAAANGVAGESDYAQRAFGESAAQRLARVRSQSPWGAHPNWSMSAMIVKAGDDLRQEELALQLIHTFDSIWREAGLTCRTHPYIALSTSSDAGLLEVVDDSNSIDGIKKACQTTSIHQFFTGAFGGESSADYEAAQYRFIESMAGYSVISYLLQIRDRHNGNLMVSRRGELVHIDFGFLFVTSPGGFNFESAPFKLSQELIDVMGGQDSDGFSYYKVLVYQALDAARDRFTDILALVSLMVPFNSMPCFGADPSIVVGQLRNRFRYDLQSEADYALFAKDLISNSADNWRTRRYDQFQTLQNGII